MSADLSFEWDDAKAYANQAKHGVSFETAAEAFFADDAVVIRDIRREYGELRFNLFATVERFPVCVTYTLRGETVRIISARKANRKER